MKQVIKFKILNFLKKFYNYADSILAINIILDKIIKIRNAKHKIKILNNSSIKKIS